MKKELEDRLRIVYATGRLGCHLEDALYDFTYRRKINDVLSTRMSKLNAIVDQQTVFQGKVVYEWVIYMAKDPPFSEWTSLRHDKKLKWFEDNNRKYPVLWLQCSRVWPAYYWYYNIWKNPSTENPNIIECIEEPYDNDWLPIHKLICNIMNELRIDYLTKEDLLEPVPFVLNEMWLDKENGSNNKDVDDDEPIPYLDGTAIVQCLFQNE